MAIQYLKKSPKTSSTDDSKTREIVENILNNKEIGSLDWIEYRELKEGVSAFKEIHNGSCESPKIILLINS